MGVRNSPDLARDGFVEKIIVIDSKGVENSDAESLEDFVGGTLGGRKVDLGSFRPVEGDASKLGALIMASSGTTGLPKGVLLSQKNILVRLMQSR